VLYQKNKINIFDLHYFKSIALFFALFVFCYLFLTVDNLNAIQIIIGIAGFYLGFLVLWFVILGEKEFPQIIKLLKNDR
jgi:hypothetical protein